MSAAEEILERVLAAAPTLGSSRLVALDGPSGSGKSTIARAMTRLADLTVVHTDDLCPGWDGIPELPRILADLLEPLSRGDSGRVPRYDWILGRQVEDVVLAPVPVVVVEGVGAGARSIAAWTTTLVWVDADAAVRRERALARDGDDFRPYWDAWAAAEQTYFAADGVVARADLRIMTA